MLLGKPRQVILDDAHALRSFLVATVKEMTGACEVDTTTSFADLGVDSLHIILLVHKIRDEMMLTVQQLDETTLYDSKYSTIDGLTTYCLQVGQQSVVAQSVACPTPQSTSCFVQAVSCEYPRGLTDMRTLFDFLMSEKDAVSEVPVSRWDIDSYYSEEKQPGFLYTRHGSFLARNPFAFDAKYFGLAPREVKYMDPQQRLLLETAEQVMVTTSGSLAERVRSGPSETGVFVVSMTRDFGDQLCLHQVQQGNPSALMCVCSCFELFI